MLEKLEKAASLKPIDVEILCSWNGNSKDEKSIDNISGYNFEIVQKEPYHFAKNINSLASKAKGELLLIINDDVFLDAESIDEAIECLESNPNSGIVGGRLRNQEGQLRHAGINFDTEHSPYHYLDLLIASNHPRVMRINRKVPAVTGAMILIRREHFIKLLMNETYNVCGEDIELCLDIRQKLGLDIWYCPTASGIHEGESTRKTQKAQGANLDDIKKMRKVRSQFIQKASLFQLRDDMHSQCLETEVLRRLEEKRESNFPEIIYLRQEVKKWQNQTHALHILRLKHDQQLAQMKRELASLKGKEIVNG